MCIRDSGGLCHFDHNPGGVDPVGHQSVPHACEPAGRSQLDSRDVDADRTGQVRTLREQGAGLVQDLGANGGDQPAVLGDVQELPRTEQPTGGVRPAHECLVSDHVGVGQGHDGLVVHHELPGGDRLTQLVLDGEAGQRLGVHRLVEEVPARPPVGLGPGQRGVCVVQQALGRRGRGRGGDTDGRGRHDPVTSNLQVDGDRGGHPLGAAFDVQDVLDVLAHDDELVPTEASDPVTRAQGGHDPVRDGGQHLVAGRVTKGVVDDLEVVQVHEQCPHRMALTLGGSQVDLQDVQDPGPVVQPGQRVVESLVGQSLLSFVLGGDVFHLDHNQVRLAVPVVEQHRHPSDPDRGAIGAYQTQRRGARVARSGDDSGATTLRLVRADGATVWVRRVTMLLHDGDGQANLVMVQVEDITAEHEAQEALTYQAFHDPLTGLHNRAWILDILKVDLRAAKRLGHPVVALFVDLDNFKVVNDSLGHVAGDEVLATVADRIVANTSSPAT